MWAIWLGIGILIGTFVGLELIAFALSPFFALLYNGRLMGAVRRNYETNSLIKKFGFFKTSYYAIISYFRVLWYIWRGLLFGGMYTVDSKGTPTITY